MANSLTNILPKILARGLMVLRERCVLPRLVNSSYASDAAMKGTTIDVPIPTAVTTIDVTPSHVPSAPGDTTPALVQVPLDNWKQNTPFHLTDRELVEIDKNRHFLPGQVDESIRSLANDVNADIFDEYTGVYGFVAEAAAGATVTEPMASDTGVIVDTRKKLNEQLCPSENRRIVLSHESEASALKLSEFTAAQEIGSPSTRIQGEIGRRYGIDFYADDQVPTHTAGTWSDGLVVVSCNGAHAVGVSTLSIDLASSTKTVVKGDIFTIAGDSQQYVATAAAALSTSAASVTISPDLKVALTDNEVVTPEKSHVVNLAFHRDAFAFATRPLVTETSSMALGSQILSMQDPQTGLVLRLEVSRQHKQIVWEFDILWGAKLVRPELACRIAGDV